MFLEFSNLSNIASHRRMSFKRISMKTFAVVDLIKDAILV